MGRSREDVSHVCAIAVKIRQDGVIVVIHAGLVKSVNNVNWSKDRAGRTPVMCELCV